MRPGRLIKRILPTTLLGRSILIIVMPLIILQLVAGWVFYDRHLATITKRLASAAAGEVGMLIDLMQQYPGPENRSWIFRRLEPLRMAVTLHEGAILPNEAPAGGSGMLHDRLQRALAEHVRRPYRLDTDNYGRRVRIQVQLKQGVLDIFIARERLFSETTYIFVMWSVGTAMVMFGVAALFMRNQVRPIRRLVAAVDDFGKGREVPPLRMEGATEIRQAATAFGRMRARIQGAMAHRTEMLAGISHDLRTPLTRMKLALALLGEAPGVADLKTDVAEMEKMVDEYLDFARGEGAEAVAPADLSSILAEIVERERRAGAAIALDSQAGLEVPVRPNAIRRCLTNVVANATRYAGHTAVSAARNGSAIEIVVDDDGPGIPEELREEVFKPFYRLEGSRNPRTGGTGLGLTIARDVIRNHGGDIALETAPLGGLRARLRLPV